MLAHRSKMVGLLVVSVLLAVMLLPSGVIAEESAAPAISEAAAAPAIDIHNLKVGLDTVWLLLGAFLVFFMQAGFGMVEAGFIRAKNTCNILTKNFLDFCMASVAFFLVGYALMFGEGNGCSWA
jgi:Amt family ammonium transporter